MNVRPLMKSGMVVAMLWSFVSVASGQSPPRARRAPATASAALTVSPPSGNAGEQPSAPAGSRPSAPVVDSAFLQTRILRLFDLAVTAASLRSCESITLARTACLHVVSNSVNLSTRTQQALIFEGSARSNGAFVPSAPVVAHVGVEAATRFCQALLSTNAQSASTYDIDRDHLALSNTAIGRFGEGTAIEAVRSMAQVCYYPPIPADLEREIATRAAAAPSLPLPATAPPSGSR